MNNYEWLKMQTIQEMAKIIDGSSCDVCFYNGGANCYRINCVDGIEKWLQQERKESMPELKAGDVLNVQSLGNTAAYLSVTYLDNDYIFSNVLGVRQITGNYKIIQVWRFNDGTLNLIWQNEEACKYYNLRVNEWQ